MKSCAERIDQEYKDLLTMLDKADAYIDDAVISRIGEDVVFNHGVTDKDKINEVYENVRTLLCKDVVRGGTFHDEPRTYTRYQFSYGGPSDEVRVFNVRGKLTAEYWFLDWFDGAMKTLPLKYIKKLQAIYGY